MEVRGRDQAQDAWEPKNKKPTEKKANSPFLLSLESNWG
jgi:hypothetical protein